MTRTDESPPRPGGQLLEGGARFGLRSVHATRVEVRLYEPRTGGREVARHELARTGDRFHVEVPGVTAGTRYTFHVDGPAGPPHAFDPEVELLDPLALAVEDRRAVLVDPTFDWGDDAAPRTPWEETLIYEAHVKGLTMRHPALSAEERGTYLGLCAEPIVEHLLSLGVTALELMPVQHCRPEEELVRRGLTNYWGYSPIGFRAVDTRFASRPERALHELQTAVRRLHEAGIEVILDLVFNHSAEGGPAKPAVSLRGIDNALYYRIDRKDPARYVDWTGCGNTLDSSEPAVTDLVLECLRFFVREVHVDGFRLDLAPALFRGKQRFRRSAPLFAAIARDPLLAPCKWIAEPWDLGPGGYQLGSFPSPWREWNDRFRDCARRRWRGDPDQEAEFEQRLAGSPDLFGERAPTASIDFVTCHDGFTLRDLVSYSRKDNARNGDGDGGGLDENYSSSHGVEGPTDDPQVNAARDRARHNLIASLMQTQGVPMLSHGDELGRTQGGNNNAYCLDDETTWVDWEGADARFLETVRELARGRRGRPS